MIMLDSLLYLTIWHNAN